MYHVQHRLKATSKKWSFMIQYDGTRSCHNKLKLFFQVPATSVPAPEHAGQKSQSPTKSPEESHKVSLHSLGRQNFSPSRFGFGMFHQMVFGVLTSNFWWYIGLSCRPRGQITQGRVPGGQIILGMDFFKSWMTFHHYQSHSKAFIFDAVILQRRWPTSGQKVIGKEVVYIIYKFKVLGRVSNQEEANEKGRKQSNMQAANLLLPSPLQSNF